MEGRTKEKLCGLDGSLKSSFLNKGKEWEKKANSSKHVSFNVLCSIKARTPFYLLLVLNLFLKHNCVLRPHGVLGSFELQRKCSFVQSPLHISFETHNG